MRQRFSTRPRRRAAAATATLGLVATALTIVTGTAGPAQAGSCTQTFPGQVPSVNYTDAASVTISLKNDELFAPYKVTRPDCNNPRVVDLTFDTAYVAPNEAGINGPKVPKPKARVILPVGYNQADTTKKYAVLYLLHGGGVGPDAGYKDWTGGDFDVPWDAPVGSEKYNKLGHAYTTVNANNSVNAKAQDNLIVVMPEGAALGQYADWAYATQASPPKLSPRYKSWITSQLVPWVDANFRTKKTASGGHNPQANAIAGYSMGGMGALNLARQSGLFNTVASFSGVTDLQDDGSQPFGHTSPGFVLASGMQIWDGIDPSYIFGQTWQGPPVNVGTGTLWTAYNPIKNAGGLTGKDVWLTTGANDPSRTDPTDPELCDQHDFGKVAEAAICVVNTKYNAAIAALPAASRPSPYTFKKIAGANHDFINWNVQLADWLNHAMPILKAA